MWKVGKNWLEDWWLQYAYLSSPSPLPVNSNCYSVFNKNIVKSGIPQSLQASRLISSFLHTYKLLKNEQIPPEYLGNIPLCMNQYHSIFTTARIPGENGDTSLRSEPSSKIIILYQKRFYSLDILHHDGKVIIYCFN